MTKILAGAILSFIVLSAWAHENREDDRYHTHNGIYHCNHTSEQPHHRGNNDNNPDLRCVQHCFETQRYIYNSNGRYETVPGTDGLCRYGFAGLTKRPDPGTIRRVRYNQRCEWVSKNGAWVNQAQDFKREKEWCKNDNCEKEGWRKIRSTYDVENCSTASLTPEVELPPNRPDLRITSFSVNDHNPYTGDELTFTVQAYNYGKRGSQQASNFGDYANQSTTEVVKKLSDDYSLQGLVPPLSSEKTQTLTYQDTAPETAGTWYFMVCIDEVTDETDIDNNCSDVIRVNVRDRPLYDQIPDLQVEMGQFSRNTVQEGALIIVDNVVVKNMGYGDVTQGIDTSTLKFYWSQDATLDVYDEQIVGTWPISQNIPASSQITMTGFEFDAPGVWGYWYMFVCVDTDATESDTDNNCSTEWVYLDVTEHPSTAIPPTQITLSTNGVTELTKGENNPAVQVEVTATLNQPATESFSFYIWFGLNGNEGTDSNSDHYDLFTAGASARLDFSSGQQSKSVTFEVVEVFVDTGSLVVRACSSGMMEGSTSSSCGLPETAGNALTSNTVTINFVAAPPEAQPPPTTVTLVSDVTELVQEDYNPNKNVTTTVTLDKPSIQSQVVYVWFGNNNKEGTGANDDFNLVKDGVSIRTQFEVGETEKTVRHTVDEVYVNSGHVIITACFNAAIGDSPCGMITPALGANPLTINTHRIDFVSQLTQYPTSITLASSVTELMKASYNPAQAVTITATLDKPTVNPLTVHIWFGHRGIEGSVASDRYDLAGNVSQSITFNTGEDTKTVNFRIEEVKVDSGRVTVRVCENTATGTNNAGDCDNSIEVDGSNLAITTTGVDFIP